MIKTWAFLIFYIIFFQIFCRSLIYLYYREFVILFLYFIFQSLSLLSQNYSSSNLISVIVDDVLYANDFREIFLT